MKVLSPSRLFAATLLAAGAAHAADFNTIVLLNQSEFRALQRGRRRGGLVQADDPGRSARHHRIRPRRQHRRDRGRQPRRAAQGRRRVVGPVGDPGRRRSRGQGAAVRLRRRCRRDRAAGHRRPRHRRRTALGLRRRRHAVAGRRAARRRR